MVKIFSFKPWGGLTASTRLATPLMYVAYVCLQYNNFRIENLTLESQFWYGMQVHFHGIQAKFEYKGHRVNVQVTRAKNI